MYTNRVMRKLLIVFRVLKIEKGSPTGGVGVVEDRNQEGEVDGTPGGT